MPTPTMVNSYIPCELCSARIDGQGLISTDLGLIAGQTAYRAAGDRLGSNSEADLEDHLSLWVKVLVLLYVNSIFRLES